MAVPDRIPVFDASDYTARVLRPRRGSTEHEVPLHVRYHLDPAWALDPGTDADILLRVAEVRRFWQRQAGGARTSVGDICRRWLAWDDKLRTDIGPLIDDPRWWRAQVAAVVAEAPVTARPEEAPPPPLMVEATDAPDGVRLRWSVPPGAVPQPRFTVERAETPDGPRRVLRRDLADSWLLDRTPPVASQLWYYVTAKNASGAVLQSHPCPAWFAPPAAEFSVEVTGPGTVGGGWRPHPAATAVRLWRTTARDSTIAEDGVPVLVRGSATDFEDDPGEIGEVRYHLVPVYRNGNTGREAYGARTDTSVVLRPAPAAPELTGVTSHERDGELSVVCQWAPGPAEREVWRLTTPIPPGRIVPAGTLSQYGEALRRLRILDGNWAEYHLPVGHSVLVPVAVSAGLATVGAPVEVERVPTVRKLTVARHEKRVQASWEWPRGVRVAVVRWTTAGTTVEEEITEEDLKVHGYVERTLAGEATVTVVCRHRPSLGPVLESVESSAGVGGVPLVLTFAVRRKNRLSTRRIIGFESNHPCSGLSLRVRLRQSGVDDVTLAEVKDVGCAPGRPHEVTVDVPARTRHLRAGIPRFIRCDAWDGSGRPVTVDHVRSTGREVD
jgi:hypothetical protein